jgi:hypothetical protein
VGVSLRGEEVGWRKIYTASDKGEGAGLPRDKDRRRKLEG